MTAGMYTTLGDDGMRTRFRVVPCRYRQPVLDKNLPDKRRARHREGLAPSQDRSARFSWCAAAPSAAGVQMSEPRPRLQLLRWRKVQKGVVVGFADVELPNGLKIAEVMWSRRTAKS